MDDAGSAVAAPGERQAYYQAAASWQADTSGAFGREAKTAWRLTAVAGVVAVLNGIALEWLQPLRTTVAYVIAVDSQRGSVMAVHALQPGTLQSEPAVVQSMVARYVAAREGFDATRLSETFRRVELMSDAPERAAYAASLKPTSGQSPLAVYPPQAVVEVNVVSVSLLDAHDALVRYATVRGDLPGAPPQQALAHVGFRFTRGPMRQLDRFDNPLGFQVTSYTTSPA